MLTELFSTSTTMFSVIGYDMSYLEFFATIFTLICVWLVAKKNIWNWPIGIIGTTLFVFLFYQIQLYSDMLLNVWFTLTGVWGWWAWARKAKDTEVIRWNEAAVNCGTIGLIVAFGIMLGLTTSNFHIWMPQWFPQPASYPFIDAFVTSMSFAATIMMIYKRIESWFIWMAVDVISIALYAAKGVMFVAILYAIFLAICVRGLRMWKADFDTRENVRWEMS